MEIKRKIGIASVILVVGVIILYFAANLVTKFTGYTIAPILAKEDFARCLGEKTNLYVKAGCPSCANQEEMFGDFLVHLNITDCAIDPEMCVNAGIEKIPTWIINGKKVIGSRSLDELAELSGCKLNK